MSGSSFRTLFTLVLTARLQQAGAPPVGAGTGFTHQIFEVSSASTNLGTQAHQETAEGRQEIDAIPYFSSPLPSPTQHGDLRAFRFCGRAR